MSNLLAVLLDGIAQLEYDRDKPMPDHQAVYLNKMDEKMAKGITVEGKDVVNPDLAQRAQFVAANLVHAITTDDESQAAALCTYLADRLPELKQIKITTHEGEVSIDLIFDEEYKKQVPVQFTLH